MRYSVVNKSECAKYDFGNFLFSPDFFMRDKLDNWRMLVGKSSKTVTDFFLHIIDVCEEISRETICYDLVDGLLKFFEKDVLVSRIASAKKIAQEGDFLISRMGSYLQEMGVVEKRQNDQLFSTEFLVFRPKTDSVSSFTLFALCMTDAVQTILKHGQYGTVQQRFYDFLLTKLPVPDCLLAIDHSVQKAIQQAICVRALSRDIYAQAQSMLLSELGLADWRPRHHLSFIKHYADLQNAERIDADYFQPKYDEIVDAIKACRGGWETLGDLVSLKKCIEVGRGEYLDEGIPFVRVSNLSPFEISKEKYISDSLYSDIKEHQPKQGEILLTKDATPGVAHYLKDAPEKMIPSGGILRLKTKADGVNNEYLTLVLNSILTKEQVNRDVGGSVILHWLPKQVKGVVVPMLPLDKQTQIAQKVDEAFTLRKQSKHLLECAKRAVEIAIEKGERAAVEWLEREAG